MALSGLYESAFPGNGRPVYALCRSMGATLMTAVDAVGGPAQVHAAGSLAVLSGPAFTIARLAGELDVATIPALRERLLSAAGPDVRLLIIDLSGVSFCDVAALAAL